MSLILGVKGVGQSGLPEAWLHAAHGRRRNWRTGDPVFWREKSLIFLSAIGLYKPTKPNNISLSVNPKYLAILDKQGLCDNE